LTIGGKYLRERGEVALAWPYRDCVLEGGQTKEEEKRKEIFFNEVLAQDEINRLLDPKVLTNFTRYTAKGKEKVRDFKRDENGLIRENLIIKGNNLLALHTLKTQFREKVKLIYIDPPYNTGNDSFGYNDNFNHSTWLTFMKNRLEVARELLSPTGVIFIQCDDNEQAYLKILLDEIFLEENFINTISVNMKNVAGASGGGEDKKLKKNIEYIHVYTKNYALFSSFTNVYNYIPVSELIELYRKEDISWKYNTILVHEGDKKYVGSNTDGYGGEIKIFLHTNPIFKSINNVMKEENLTENQVYNKYFKSIFQTAMPQSSIRSRIIEKVEQLKLDGNFFSVEYIPRTGRNKGVVYKQFYKGEKFRLLAWLSDVSEEIEGVLYKKELQGTFWDFVGETKNLTKEGSVELLSGKKPEKLLKRIIEMSTEKHDIVLDYHLGSGTTAAVAHKLGRQYIGIEQLDYGENDSVNRLQNVIKGDQSGISKSVNWKGGGDFIYCELMKYNEAFMERIQIAKSSEELLEIWKAMAENSFLNWYINPEMPEEAVKDFEEIGKEQDGLEKQKKLLAELLDKNQLYVNLTEIDDTQFKVGEEEKELNRKFFGGKV
jgi:adenine-specific DNA-methyltransferase